MWIYEHRGWPGFAWDAEGLACGLAEVRHRQGRLLGRMEGLGFDLRREAGLVVLTEEVVKSSAIEGERLDRAEVRSSIARRLGLDAGGLVPAGRDVDGVVEMMLDATRGFAEPLTKERLHGWQAALFPAGRSGIRRIVTGGWRRAADDPMQVVSGPAGRERVHFQAPPAGRVEREMGAFLRWFEGARGGRGAKAAKTRESDMSGHAAIDPVLQAGIAHLWFVTVHPFEDGNGRIARTVSDMVLARADGVGERFYSLSSQIEAERQEYYRQLEARQRGGLDITPWLQWFLGCLGRALSGADETLGRVLFKAKLWEALDRQQENRQQENRQQENRQQENRQPENQKPVNPRQRAVINRMTDDDFEGYINTSKYAKLAKCSTDTALRDIQDLKTRGILLQNPARGRSTSYRLTLPSG